MDGEPHYRKVKNMMTPDAFKDELLILLKKARNENHEFYTISIKDFFDTYEAQKIDIRAYIATDIQELVRKPPYYYQYLISRSNASELVFFDIKPQTKEYSNGVSMVYRVFNCDEDKIEITETEIRPKK